MDEPLVLTIPTICSHTDISSIGLFVKNGVFSETSLNYGITYCLDKILFEELGRKIEDTGLGKVSATTHYGYSEFIVCCKPCHVMEVFQHITSICVDNSISSSVYDDCSRHIQSQRLASKTFHNLYYERRIPESRLCVPIAPTTQIGFPTLDAIQQWYQLYFSGSEKYVLADFKNHFTDVYYYDDIEVPPTARLPLAPVSLPNHIPWKRSRVMTGVDVYVNRSNLLSLEALCLWLKPALAAKGADLAGRICAPQINLDFAPELQISGTCARGLEKAMICAIEDVLLALSKPHVPLPLEHLQDTIIEYYTQMHKSPKDWNKFWGWNIVSEKWYTSGILNSPTAIQNHITEDAVRSLLNIISGTPISCSFVAPLV